MGLAPIDPSAWLQIDAEWARYRAHKQALGARDQTRVCQQLPEAADAIAELGTVLRQHLIAHHSAHFARDDHNRLCHTPSAQMLEGERGAPSLWRLSTWVQEDLLILQHSGDNYRLVAGSLCLPSRWSLTEKMGQPLHTIHTPVPGLNAALGERIDRVFNHLRTEHPIERFNWSLQSDDALADFPGPDEPVQHLHYRVERQTMRRLPETGAVVFTVRIYVVPFDAVAAVPDAAEQLQRDIAAMPEAFSAYKRMPLFRDALATFTDTSTQELDP